MADELPIGSTVIREGFVDLKVRVANGELD